VASKKQATTEISIIALKHENEIRFFVNIKCQTYHNIIAWY